MGGDEWPITEQALRKADRHLGWLEDAILDDGDDIPPWVVAARTAVREKIRREFPQNDE